MTTATVDPAVAIAAAGRELLDALRQVVDRDDTDDVPGLLDELTGLLRRARGKVNRATKRSLAEQQEPAAPTPVGPPPAGPAPEPAAGADKPPTSSRAVTLAIPDATRQPAPASANPPKEKPMQQPPPTVTTPPTATPRRSAWPRIVAVVTLLLILVAILLLTGCSSGTAAQAPPSTVTVTSAPNPNQIECANVERAYNAWKWTPASSADFADFKVRMLMEEGKDFLKAVDGYKDTPAAALALAIAQYNVDVAMVNASFAASGSVDSTVTQRVVDGVGKINGAYAAFKFEICR